LRESGEWVGARRRHAEFFLRFATSAEERLVGAEQAAWVHRLDAEHANFLAAFETFAGADSSVDLSTTAREAGALGLAAALGRFWYYRGRWGEGRRLCDRALAAASTRTRPEASVVCNWAGLLATNQGDFESARRYLEQSLAIRQELGDQ